jgi:phenylalanyl-tRNA synthetase beta chain
VAVVELFLDRIPAKKAASGFARPHFAPPALQAVTRDFAFLVADKVPAGDLLRAVKGADKTAIVAARVFDDFRGRACPKATRAWPSK